MTKVSKGVSRNFFPMPGSDRLNARKIKHVPHEFVLEAISALSPWTRPMFGCLAVYVENKIVLILRDKPDNLPDNGVWLATTSAYHESLRRDFPSMRSIQVLGSGVTGWQLLPQTDEHFEEEAQRACEFVLAGDPRIGKIPGAKRISKTKNISKKNAKKEISNKKDNLKPAKKSSQAPKRKPRKRARNLQRPESRRDEIS
jgi:hypothetical protein